MEVFLLFFLVLFNGLFAMSEMALVSASRARLQKTADSGDAGAQMAIRLGEDPNRFLSTIQVGITSIGVLSGIVGESALAPPLAAQLVGLGMDSSHAWYAATGAVVVLITYFSIVLGELVPKRLGQSHPEVVARAVSRPIAGMALAARPFVRLLSGSTHLMLRLLGVTDRTKADVTEEEIQAVLEEGTEAGLIETQEHMMVKNVFRLDQRLISSLMVPRSDIVYLDAVQGFEANLAVIKSSDYARFPVVRGGLDNLLGLVSARKLLLQAASGKSPELVDCMEEALYVPETLTAMELLEKFQSSGHQLAFVVDEFGEILGLVALQDLIEAITGELEPSDPQEARAVERDDGSWLLDGHISILDLKESLKIASVPDGDGAHYHTLSGMLMFLSGNLPAEGDVICWADWQFEIVDMDRQTIDKVLARTFHEPRCSER